MQERYSLPRVISLPDGPIVLATLARIALGQPSRQVLHLWRGKGFPTTIGSGQDAMLPCDALERWLVGQGVTVKRGEK